MFGHRTRTTTMLAGLVAFTACTYYPANFPIYGTTDERARLAGDWEGEFDDSRAGGGGSISFRLEAGRDSASGDVTLLASHIGNAQLGYETRVPTARTATRTTLRIGYASVGASLVEGILEPFRDPECDCMVDTSFRGELRGDSIVGRYVSRRGWTMRRGEWRMSRRR